MPESSAEKQRRYRDKLRGGPPRELKPCGTRAAKVRHQRNDEECAVCWPNRHKDRSECSTCQGTTEIEDHETGEMVICRSCSGSGIDLDPPSEDGRTCGDTKCELCRGAADG